MSALRLKGKVVYLSGAWGAGVGAGIVHVEIVQHHFLSTNTTTIWSGTTDASGQFTGTSSEWRRVKTVRIGTLQRTQPDPSDVLALTATITDPAAAGVPPKTFVFAFLGDNVPAPPLVLDWRPPGARKGSANGIECFTHRELMSRAAAAFAARGRVVLQLNARSAQAAGQLKTHSETAAAKITADARAIQADMQSAIRIGAGNIRPGQDGVEATADLLLAAAARILRVEAARCRPLVITILRAHQQVQTVQATALSTARRAASQVQQTAASLPKARVTAVPLSSVSVPLLQVVIMILVLIILSLVTTVERWEPYFRVADAGQPSVPVTAIIDIMAFSETVFNPQNLTVLRKLCDVLGLTGQLEHFIQQFPLVPVITICVLILWIIVASLYGYAERWAPYLLSDILVLTFGA